MSQIPVISSEPYEIRRIEHTRLRRRLLEGTWEEDLHNRLQIHLGTVRKAAWGYPDMSSNIFRQIARALSALYVMAPDVTHPTRMPAAVDLVDKVARSGLWATMNRFQQLVVGCREYWQRVHVAADGRLTFRPVSPDMTVARSFADRPDYPVAVHELRERLDVAGKPIWTWDVLDISNPENPIYEVRAYVDGGKMGEDLSGVYLGGNYSGAAYPYRRNDGRPILPYVLYHAERIGDRLWDAWEGVEVVEGSLNIAVSYSMLFHAIKDSSWPQRYIVGAEPQGATLEGGVSSARREVVSDPATVLMLRATDEQQPVIGQWQAGQDVTILEQTIAACANRLAQDAGVSPADIQRMGGTARSGYAIALSNEGKREAQRSYAQSFRESDEELVMKAAILLNRVLGTQYPEGGYSVQYRSIPLSGSELDARRKHALELLDAGLMTRLDALRLFDDALTEQDAAAMLAEIDAMNKAREMEDDAAEMEGGEPEEETPEHEAAPGDAAEDIAEGEPETDGEACPIETQDIAVNLKNRQKAINVANYGPADPNNPGDYWDGKAARMRATVEDVSKMKCANCAFFDVRRATIACIEKGIGGGAAETVAAGRFGLCEAFDFKCAGARTCDAWVVGGPISDTGSPAVDVTTEAKTTGAAPDESIAAAAAASGQPASAVALNGAQVQAAQGIITSVAKGELPRATGVEMLVQFFNMDPEAADTLMGTVGGSFTIAAETPSAGS